MRLVTSLGLAVFSALASCNSVLGIDELPREGPPELVYAAPQCQACVAKHCGTKETACTTNEQCLKWATCAASVPPDAPAARFACDTNYHEGSESTEGVALDACRREACASDCIGIGGFLSFGPACSACLIDESKCKTQVEACVRDPLCDRGAACIGGAPDPDRGLHCVYDVAKNTPTLKDVEDCWDDCRPACPIGSIWSCLGTYPWGSPGNGGSVPFDFKLSVGAGEGAPPANGVTVVACTYPSETCEVASQGETVDGRVKLLLPIDTGKPGGGFKGYLRATREEPPIVPELWFLGRPIYRYETRIGGPVLKESELTGFAVLRANAKQVDMKAHGHLSVLVWDCLFQEAPDIDVEIDSAALDPTGMTETYPPDSPSTDPTGLVLFFNLVPGCFTVKAKRNGEPISQRNVLIQAGTVSVLYMFPKWYGDTSPSDLDCKQ